MTTLFPTWACRLAAFSATSLLMLSAVTAQDAVTELHALDTPDGKLVLAVSGNGVTFLKPKEGTSFRAFKNQRKAMKGDKADWITIRDANSDGQADVIGLGKPIFLVSSSAEPIHNIASGCDQARVANFQDDKSLEIACRKGSTMKMMTHDGQKLWDYKIQGIRLGLCQFGDLNGDNKHDIECKVKGKNNWLRLSGSGEELGRTFDEAALDGEVEDDNPGYANTMANYLKGEELFDLNGDGTAEEWVKMDGKALVIGSRAGGKAIARHETGPITSILAQDLDGDGKADLIAGGKGKVFFFDAAGKLTATVISDPKKLKRKTDVIIDSVRANNLENDDEAAVRPSLDKGKAKLASCYAGNVKKNPYTRVGRTIWALNIDKKGKVSKVERLHSDLSDKKVENCLRKAMKKMSFPKAKEADANVTVTLKFGFLDQ